MCPNFAPMKNRKDLEGIPYTVQVLRWIGGTAGVFLILGGLISAFSDVDRQGLTSLLRSGFLVGYGVLLVLSWRRLARLKSWPFSFILLVVLSAVFMWKVGYTSVRVTRGEDARGTLSFVLVAVFLNGIALTQPVCAWIMRRQKQRITAMHQRAEWHPAPAARSTAAKSRWFVEVEPALRTIREQWVGMGLFGLILLFFLLGLSVSVSVPAGKESISFVSAVKSLASLDVEQLRKDHLVRSFIWYLPPAMLLWSLFLTNMRIRCVAWGCVLAALLLPWFFLAPGLAGILQFLYLPILAFTSTIGILFGTMSGTDYQEGAACMAAFGWWIVLWICIAVRMMIPRGVTAVTGGVPADIAVQPKLGDEQQPQR